jgi:hypothetical protein
MRIHRLATIVIFGCAALSGAGRLAAAGPAGPLATVPFEEFGSSVFLPVSVNGSRPLWLILDSGANTCIVDQARARELGIQPQEEGRGTGAGAGTTPYRKLRQEDVSFKLKSLAFSCEHTIAMDFSQNFEVTGHELEGVLGSDFFQRFVVEIDYDARVVRLFEPASFEYRGRGEPVPLLFDKRVPHVMAELTVTGEPPQTKRLLVDSGSEDAVDDDIVLKSQGPKREVTGGVGTGQEYKVTFGTLSRFRLGSFVLETVPSVAPGVALIGGEVLRRFTVTFDYSRQRMYLEPNRHLNDAFEGTDSQGMELRLAADRKNLRVHDVHKGSPAEKAGLRTGDLITDIDGTAASDLGFRRAMRLLRRSGQSFRLQVERDSRRLEVLLAGG